MMEQSSKPVAVTIIVPGSGPVLSRPELPYWIRTRTVKQIANYVALFWMLRLVQPKPKDN